MMSVSPPGQKSGRQGIRTLTTSRSLGLADRPGPATHIRIPSVSSGPGGSRTRIPSTPGWRLSVGPQARSYQSGEWGSNPRSPASRTGGLPLSYPLKRVDRRGIAPRFPPCDGGVFLWTSSPAEVRLGIEPSLPRLPGRRAATTPPDQRVAEAGFEPASDGL